MILSTQNDLFQFKYLIFDLIKEIAPVTQYKAIARRTPENSNNIELGAIDEEDKVFIERFIREGATRAYEVLTFLTNGVIITPGAGKTTRTFSWKEAGTESREAVVITVGQKDWMADDIETPMDEAILSVIKAYTLLQWYKSTGQYQDAQIYAIDYDNAKIDLRTAARKRRYNASRPNQFLP